MRLEAPAKDDRGEVISFGEKVRGILYDTEQKIQTAIHMIRDLNQPLLDEKEGTFYELVGPEHAEERARLLTDIEELQKTVENLRLSLRSLLKKREHIHRILGIRELR